MRRAYHVYLSEGGIVNDHHHVIINMIMITIISIIMAIRGKVYFGERSRVLCVVGRVWGGPHTTPKLSTILHDDSSLTMIIITTTFIIIITYLLS